jgi:Flp pilus assembly protein TadG
MQRFQAKPRWTLLTAFRTRASEALCIPSRREQKSTVGPRTAEAQKARTAEAQKARTAEAQKARTAEAQKGSAVVEFTFLALLLMVPVVYFVVTVGQIQGGSFAVVGAADQAAKVFIAEGDVARGRTAAERTVGLALKDYGYAQKQALVEIVCDRADCLSAGAMVTVTVGLDVPLPLVPFGDVLHLKASRLTASSTQVVGRYK